MSWRERIKSPLTITTGDGKTYQPLSKLTPISQGHNFSIFEFINVKGSYVERLEPKGRRFTLDIYFDGDNNFDVAEEFRVSTEDKRPWSISHPVYGLLKCQLISDLNQDPTMFQTTHFTCEVMETIDLVAPDIGKDPKNFALRSIGIANDANVEYLSQTDLSISGTVAIQDNINDAQDSFSNLQINTDQANEYTNLFNSAVSALSGALSNASTLASSLNAFLTYPALFEVTVKAKLNALQAQFDTLNSKLPFINSKEDKIIYENNGNAIVSTALEASLNPLDGDYLNLPDVVYVINFITNMNNTFIANLNSIQSSIGGLVNGYTPNYNTLNTLNSALTYTLSQLQIIALGAQQARYVKLSADSNPIVLAHRFYGPGEENINRFINENNIILNRILIVPKDFELVYYV